jgi:hypothetical protein
VTVEAMAIALHHSRSRGSAKLVLIGIANHDGDGGAWPSMGTLSLYAGCNERNVHYAVETLVKLGEISVDTNGGGMRATADHMLKCPPNCDGTSRHTMLCTVCAKPLPQRRRRLLFHLACGPLSLPTPPVATDTPPLSQETDELPMNDAEPVNEERSVLNREGITPQSGWIIPEGDGSTIEADAYGDDYPDGSPVDFVPCPARPVAPCSLTSRGVCIDIARHPKTEAVA